MGGRAGEGPGVDGGRLGGVLRDMVFKRRKGDASGGGRVKKMGGGAIQKVAELGINRLLVRGGKQRAA